MSNEYPNSFLDYLKIVTKISGNCENINCEETKIATNSPKPKYIRFTTI